MIAPVIADVSTDRYNSSEPPAVPEDEAWDPLAFTLPAELEAGEPPEARGLARDEVRLMVSRVRGDQIVHTRFRLLPEFLDPGDVLVINTSATLNAALPAARADGTSLELHLSTRLPAGLWLVELRWPDDGSGTKPFFVSVPSETLRLPAGGLATLHATYDGHRAFGQASPTPNARLWIASLEVPVALG